MIRVNFADKASRDAFADRFKLDAKVGDVQLDIGWHLLQFAKKDDNALDYEEVVVLQSGSSAKSEKEFIVKGNPTDFADHGTIVENLGNGFFIVKSSNGLVLGDHVESIEEITSPTTFLGNASDIAAMSGDDTTLDPTSPEGQWARIRCASRYRPLLDAYSTYEMNYNTKPELYIVDTGIHFENPEFDYPGIEKVDFWTLPRWNNDFTGYNSHGTSVASMAAGKNLGIANNLKLLSVKIKNQGDDTASIYELGQAFDAIAAVAEADPTITRIVNCSWGVARSAYLDAKVQRLLDLGITVVCAAGNNGISVEDISPAGMNDVITVASVDKYDIPSGFNNISPTDAGITTGHGLSLDLFAPGENVMVAFGPSGYKIVSGTSFSAPLVAGIACEIGALNRGVVPYSIMKPTVLDTATVNALLFEPDASGQEKFSENQNRLAYIFTADPNANYKLREMTMYLGVHFDDQPIVADLNSSINTAALTKVTGDSPVYSIQWDDPALEAAYGSNVTVNPSSGMLSITKPQVSLPAETKLKMVEFKGVVNISGTKIETPLMFFFDTNPDYKETQQSDITLALTNTNSISFFGFWGIILK